jgi:hypothetical protein
VKQDCLSIAVREPTALQLSAWQRLWAILLSPVESQSASRVNECEVKPETATPLRRQQKRFDADEPIRPRKEQQLGATPNRQMVPGERPGGYV